MSKIETLLPRKGMELPPEKFSSTMQPSRIRRTLFVPCPVSPALLPGQVRSHSPTQKSSCFCSGSEHGLGWGEFACCAVAVRSQANIHTMMKTNTYLGCLLCTSGPAASRMSSLWYDHC